jgi:hypothetical protein
VVALRRWLALSSYLLVAANDPQMETDTALGPPGLAGRWRVVMFSDMGKTKPATDDDALITEDRLFVCGWGPKYTCGASGKIDVHRGGGGQFLGIYRVEGRRLSFCWDRDGKSRPADFRAGENRIVIVLERRER